MFRNSAILVVLLLVLAASAAFAGGPPAVFSLENNWGEMVTASVGSVTGFVHTASNYPTLDLEDWQQSPAMMSEITKIIPAPGQFVDFEGSVTNVGHNGNLGDNITLTVVPQDTADYMSWRLFIEPTNSHTYTEVTDLKNPIVLSANGSGYNSWLFDIQATNNMAPVPEPSTLAYVMTGCFGLIGGFLRRRR